MYKNQLQELAQRSCFNLPSYTCLREGPDHAPRFKAVVNFNGESFESPQFCTNLRQAEHAAAEAALLSLSSHSLAARILDETGVYKNLLQEIAQRVGSPLPRYTTYRQGLGHVPAFTGIVELAGITFKGEPAKNKKQAEKNAALAAWSSLKQLAQQDASFSTQHDNNEEWERIRIARALQNYRMKLKLEMVPYQKRFSSPQRPFITSTPTPKILPLFRQPQLPTTHNTPAAPFNHCRMPYRGIAPPVTIRTAIPVFSAPPHPLPTANPVPAIPASSEAATSNVCEVDVSTAIKCLEQLEI